MSVITRFAPSPTGFLHIGSARTALFNYLFAKNNNGKFLIRIEDTDQKRSTNEAIDIIKNGLNWLGLKHDNKIILQSQNITRHKEIAKELLAKDLAYYCYTPAEELEEIREKAKKQGEIFRFKSPWRDKKPSHKSDIKPVIRIKSPIIGESIINDLVQGEVKVKNTELDDFVILRSDETPTYMLAVVVDDYDMNISHIIRGDDHLTNAFRQKVIYQAMGWKVPDFAHIPLIHGQGGAKMSKRHGATSVMEYKEMGYLPETIRNYLLRLGWSHGDDEIISDKNALKWFNLENIGKSPARFDFAKLDNINKHYIKTKSEIELFNLISHNLENISDNEKERIIKSLTFTKERATNLNDLTSFVKIYLDNFTTKLDSKSLEVIQTKKDILTKLLPYLEEIKVWNHDNIKDSFDNFTKAENLKIKDFGPALRISLTFSSSSAGGIFNIVEILERNEVIKRIKNSL